MALTHQARQQVDPENTGRFVLNRNKETSRGKRHKAISPYLRSLMLRDSGKLRGLKALTPPHQPATSQYSKSYKFFLLTEKIPSISANNVFDFCSTHSYSPRILHTV